MRARGERVPSGSDLKESVSVEQKRRRLAAAIVDSAAWIVGIVIAVEEGCQPRRLVPKSRFEPRQAC